MGLEQILASVSSEAELWTVVHDNLTQPSPRWDRNFVRFTQKEAEAFREAGRRIGLNDETLVTEYWRRANKDNLGPALEVAKAGLNREFADVHSGYDLQYAIDQHFGWMRAAEIPVPPSILKELSEHGRVLAEHAKANTSWGYQLTPVVEMFESVLPEDALRDTRIAAANTRLKRILDSFFSPTGDELKEFGNALNTLQRYEVLEEKDLGRTLYLLGLMFRQGYESTAQFLSTWDWSPYKDNVYGKFVVTMSDPELGKGTSFFSGFNIDPRQRFAPNYASLSSVHKPSPAHALIMYKQLKLFETSRGTLESLTAVHSAIAEQAKETTDNEAKTALEKVLDRELGYAGLQRAVIKPLHLNALLDIYRELGGNPNEGPLKEAIDGYIQNALFDKDVAQTIALAKGLHLGPEDNPDMYTRVVVRLSEAAQSLVAMPPIFANRDSIAQQKQKLAAYAERLIALAKNLNNVGIAHEQLTNTVKVLFNTRYGIGLHYLSTLIVEYNQAFGRSPLEIIAGTIDPNRLRDYFIQEKGRARQVNMSGDFRRYTFDLYDAAHKVLYGETVPNRRREEQSGRSDQQDMQRRYPSGHGAYGAVTNHPMSAPVKSNTVIVYIGSKNVDGTDHDTVEDIRKGLEAKVKGTLVLEQGDVPGLGRMYGIAMTPSDFQSLAREPAFNRAIQSIYVPGQVPQKLDERNFKSVPYSGGVYIQTRPTPHTFAIHHVTAIAQVLSSEKPK